jgi:hypothetical protein
MALSKQHTKNHQILEKVLFFDCHSGGYIINLSGLERFEGKSG